MIRLKFDGWFQCRLATDPDPSDEPRGVSGYVRALEGEPDLDRIIRLQPPFFQRSHTPRVDVRVREVSVDGRREAKHALIGAAINLLENPIFKGENGIVAEDGREPIVPFILQVTKGNLELVRSCPETPEYTQFPYPGLQAFGIVIAPGQIAAATGISDIRQYLDDRTARLKKDQEREKNAAKRDNLRRRIELLQGPVATQFFGAMMPYFVPLAGTGSVRDPDNKLPRDLDLERPWIMDFWVGGWDPDAACGFLQGHLLLPEK